MRSLHEEEEGKRGGEKGKIVSRRFFLFRLFILSSSSKVFFPCLLCSVSRKNRSKDERDLRLAGAQAENKEMIAPIRTSIYRTDEKELAETALL